MKPSYTPPLILKPQSIVLYEFWHYNCQELLKKADLIMKNRFEYLGSGPVVFEVMPWHCDVRLQAQNPQADCIFDPSKPSKDIQIPIHRSEGMGKDIKVPWELSRCNFLPIFAYAYKETKNKEYVQKIEELISDWIADNPYEYGVNWFNAMEVSLRAINWMITFNVIKEICNSLFIKNISMSLYQHKLFIENNWELYDGRTNNHYLSNLVGYLYLCWFFDDQEKATWCFEELKSEFSWQIFEEGTSYEGSTAYHRLVTELFEHGFTLAQHMGFAIDQTIFDKLERMKEFIEWCTPIGSNDMVRVGDDDSGTVLDPIFMYQSGAHQTGEKFYKEFGLSILKNDTWHVTLRHHAYKNRQPTGHFHYDIGNVTIAYKGIPILIDPGTYVYTASAQWRNHFRSYDAHNMPYTLPSTGSGRTAKKNFSSDHGELVEPFYVPILEHEPYQEKIVETAYVKRMVSIEHDQIHIVDKNLTHQKLIWRFTFAPEITVRYHHNAWIISYAKQDVLVMESSVPFTKGEGYYSGRYGAMQSTILLKTESCDDLTYVFRILL